MRVYIVICEKFHVKKLCRVLTLFPNGCCFCKRVSLQNIEGLPMCFTGTQDRRGSMLNIQFLSHMPFILTLKTYSVSAR